MVVILNCVEVQMRRKPFPLTRRVSYGIKRKEKELGVDRELVDGECSAMASPILSIYEDQTLP